MLLDKLRQSMNQTTKVAMRAIIDLNDEKTTKFPSQKEVPREELVKLCQILKLQLSEALGALEEKNDVQFIDAATDPMEIIEEEESNESNALHDNRCLNLQDPYRGLLTDFQTCLARCLLVKPILRK